MDFVIFIIVMVVLALVGFELVWRAHRKNKERMIDEFSDIEGFSADRACAGNDLKSGIAIDETRNLICLLTRQKGASSFTVLPAKQILAVELFEDGVSVTRTARGSQLAGTLIGGLALGGVGAIIGGLSGKTVSDEKVSRIDLRITVNDTSRPLHDVCFLDHDQGAKRDGVIYKLNEPEAREWLGLIKVLIHRADQEDLASQEPETMTPIAQQVSTVADELEKLARLRDEGTISDEEFEQLKAKQISS